MQLELWERETLSAKELSTVVREVRNLYWFIRTTRRGLHDARRRRVYRKISVHKNACSKQASRSGKFWFC
jgi:hypothetical protein